MSSNYFKYDKSKDNKYNQALSSFAPEIIKHILGNQDDIINPPYVTSFLATSFFADVSGFTSATEKLSKYGNVGCEILAHKINSYLPQMAKKIIGLGGDIIKFAGDALICIWPPPPQLLINKYENEYKIIEQQYRKELKKKKYNNKNINNLIEKQFEIIKDKYTNEKKDQYIKQKEYLQTSTHLATQCALEIQEEFGEMNFDGALINESRNKKQNEEEAITLRVKIGIGVGKICVLIVGGILGRCEYLICGDGLSQAYTCEADAVSGDVIVSKEVYQYISKGFEFDEIKIQQKKNNKKSKKLPPRDPRLKNYYVKKRLIRKPRSHYKNIIPDSKNKLAIKLSHFIPRAVDNHLQMPTQLWTGELRNITVLFISLPFNAKQLRVIHDRTLDRIQTVIKTLQSIIYKYQGSLNKFLIDDKGSTVMAMFGLPPVAHDNDPSRAVLAALELAKKLPLVSFSRQEPAAIGLTSGTVFVGIIGLKGTRREYSVLGDKVNLAARLMSESKKHPVKYGEVLVDKSVFIEAKEEIRLEWQELGDIRVKGKKEAITIFRPQRTRYDVSIHKISKATNLETQDRISIDKITHELNKAVSDEKKKNNQDIKGRVIFVEGEIGIGKTTLIEQVNVANSKKCWFLWGRADCFHSITPKRYIVWQQLFLSFQTRYSFLIPSHRQKLLTYIKLRLPQLYNYAFLIREIIDVVGATNDESLLEDQFIINKELIKKNKLSDTKVDRYRHDLVLCILEWAGKIKPICLVIDELQFLSNSDRQLTRRCTALVYSGLLKNVNLILGSKPMDNPRYTPNFMPIKIIKDYIQLKMEYSNCLIEPRPWSLSKTKFFIKKYLDVGKVSERMSKTIHSLCGGRPGFCFKLIEAIKSNDITTDDDESLIQYIDARTSKVPKTFVNVDRSYLIATFCNSLNEKFALGIQVDFDIPPLIRFVTLEHLDNCTDQQKFVLMAASVLCRAKGNNSLRFEEFMVRGIHPVPKTGWAEKNCVKKTLNELVNMKFIKQVKYDDSLKKFKKTGNFNTNNINVKNLNNAELIDYVDSTAFDGLTDPMPSTASLLQKPIKTVPYKKGEMFKRGIKFLNMTETTRLFIFKHRTLYWLKNINTETHPKNRIRFDETVEKLKREDDFCCKIKTQLKHYILRCKKKEEMDEWYQLFEKALKGDFGKKNKVVMTVNKLKKRKSKVVNNKIDKLKYLKMQVHEELHKKSTNKIDILTDLSLNEITAKNPMTPNNDKNKKVVGFIDLNELKNIENGDDSKNGNESDSFLSDDEMVIKTGKKDELIDASGDTYEFSYGYLRDVVYNEMLYMQRKTLHQNASYFVGKCLELGFDDELTLLHTMHSDYAMKLGLNQQQSIQASYNAKIIQKRKSIATKLKQKIGFS